MKMTRTQRAKIKNELKNQRLQQTLKEYPEVKKVFDDGKEKVNIKKFSEAIYRYPDLKSFFQPEELSPSQFFIIIKTAELRDLYKIEFQTKWTTQMADARGLRLYEDAFEFPAFEFLKECVICEKKKMGINLCPDCWERLRNALEIKTDKIRNGYWSGWGYECNCLNLDEVAKLLGLKKKPVETQQNLNSIELKGGQTEKWKK